MVIRPPGPGDAATLVLGRDEEFHRWLGPGADEPRPTACIVVDGQIVGWADFDPQHPWLAPGEVNVGYHVFALHRGRGYASRSVRLLLDHLASATQHRTATLLIAPGNERSLALAARFGFEPSGEIEGHLTFRRSLSAGASGGSRGCRPRRGACPGGSA